MSQSNQNIDTQGYITFQTLAENSPNIIMRYDTECRRVYVNPTFTEQTGIPFNKAISVTPSAQWNLYLQMRTISTKEYQKRIMHVIQTGEPIQFVIEWKRNCDQRCFTHDLYIVPEKDIHGSIIGALAIGHDITVYKQQEAILQIKELEFRTLSENLPDTIVRYDRNLKRTYVNAAWERVNYLSRDEILGKSPMEHAGRIKDTVDEFEAMLQRVLDTGKSEEFELQWKDKEGRVFFSSFHSVAEYDALDNIVSVLTISRDISSHKELERALSSKEQLFRALAENSPDSIIRYDTSCRKIYINAMAAKTFSRSASELLGETPTEATLLLNYKEFEVKLQEVICTEQESMIEVTTITQAGEQIWSEVRLIPEFDDHGVIISVLAVGRDITKRKRIEKQMAYMAHHDTLTNLPNRELAKDRATQAIAYAKRNENKVAFLFIDLDKFKDINDSIGHLAGDTILKLIASRLNLCIRETDTLSRQGGDEFLILLLDIHDSSDVLLAVDKIFTALEEPFRLGSHTLFTSVSIGISLYPDDGVTFNRLYQRADIAMYQAKAQGRNTYAFHSSTISSAMIEQLKLKNDLRTALKNNEFILHYQPQIDLSNHHIVGVEALIRWIHPELGLISPLKFIPLAESSGLIVEVGEWVLIEACKQAALWHQKQLCITIAVNISAIQFKRGNLEAVVQKALEISGLDPKFLELELTESIFIHNTHETLNVIQNIKKLGVRLSIDDFGTGYSSLTYLKRFKVDKLKIDKSFIQNLLQNQEDAVIVQTIIQMAKSLNLKTIAEGVEEQEILEAIYDYGCDEVQGYYFSKPIEAHCIAPCIDAAMKWIR